MICRECENRWGLGKPMREWPEWARTLWADHKRERRQELERLAVEGDSVKCAAYLDYCAYGNFSADLCD